MKNAILFLLALTVVSLANAQHNPDELAIRAVLDKQVVAWNEANIDEFMKGYWKSDSILFIGEWYKSDAQG